MASLCGLAQMPRARESTFPKAEVSRAKHCIIRRHALAPTNRGKIMNLEEFFINNDRIDDVVVVSFPHLEANFVVLKGPEGRITDLTIEMREIEERLELGVLKSGSDGDPSKGWVETFHGGRVLSMEYLAAPDYDFISGLRISLDVGDLVITAGGMPCSIFMSLGEIKRGEPEYPIDEYRSINPA